MSLHAKPMMDKKQLEWEMLQYPSCDQEKAMCISSAVFYLPSERQVKEEK